MSTQRAGLSHRDLGLLRGPTSPPNLGLAAVGPAAVGLTDVSEQDYRQLVGRRIRARRSWLKLSQDDLATRAGVGRNFVSAVERGVRSLEAYRLRRVALVLGIELADLLAADGRWRP